jgi:hypothetical protein
MAPKLLLEQNGPFEEGKFYRYSDLERSGIVRTWNSLKSWQERFSFPAGKLIGHTRVWSGRELNDWYATRPTARLFKNRAVA